MNENNQFMNAINIASFMIGMMNYNENLTQNDKDDIMRGIDQQTKEILENVQQALEEQNRMLKMIIEKLGD